MWLGLFFGLVFEWGSSKEIPVYGYDVCPSASLLNQFCGTIVEREESGVLEVPSFLLIKDPRVASPSFF